MRITIYNTELSKAQEKDIEALNGIVVRPALINPNILVTMATFQGQLIKMNIDVNGVIEKVWLENSPT